MFTTDGVTLLTNGANVGIGEGPAAIGVVEKATTHVVMITTQTRRIAM
jgi:hypothetical protein